jgi:acyl-CoA synthetase (AMP-forming)/AMP-acid ligase II
MDSAGDDHHAMTTLNGDYDIAIAVTPADSSFRQEQLADFCRNEMPEYMRPRTISIVNEFPLTTSGKADRSKIREMFSTAS